MGLRYCFGCETPSVIVFAILAKPPSLHTHAVKRDKYTAAIVVVVALWPAIVAPLLQQQQLFRREHRFLIGMKEVGPISMQLVSSVLRYQGVQLRRWQSLRRYGFPLRSAEPAKKPDSFSRRRKALRSVQRPCDERDLYRLRTPSRKNQVAMSSYCHHSGKLEFCCPFQGWIEFATKRLNLLRTI
jgi:hypothetical protein